MKKAFRDLTKLLRQFPFDRRNGLQYVAGLALVVMACVNAGAYLLSVADIPPRSSEDTVAWETRLLQIRYTLLLSGYSRGDVGYMPANVLRGSKRTKDDDINWVHARYTLIPLNVKQDSLDAPYVIIDYRGDPSVPMAPSGFTVKYDDAVNSMLLLRRMSP